jgi:hypothetical protein
MLLAVVRGALGIEKRIFFSAFYMAQKPEKPAFTCCKRGTFRHSAGRPLFLAKWYGGCYTEEGDEKLEVVCH